MRWHAIRLSAAILVIAGCKGQQGKFEEPSASGRTTGAPPAAEAPANRAALPAGAIPKPLEEAEETSEEVQEDIAKAKWQDASKKTQQLQMLSDSLKQIGAPAADLTTYDTAVASLAKNVQAQNQMGAALAANEVSRAAISMMTPYNPRVPVAVGYMDVDARDVIYHAQGADWTKAEQAAKDLASNYSQVQAHVAQHKPDLDRTMRTQIEQLTAAVNSKNAGAARTSAGQILDEIDNIERTFKGSNQGGQSTQPPSSQGTQQPQGTGTR